MWRGGIFVGVIIIYTIIGGLCGPALFCLCGHTNSQLISIQKYPIEIKWKELRDPAIPKEKKKIEAQGINAEDILIFSITQFTLVNLIKTERFQKNLIYPWSCRFY